MPTVARAPGVAADPTVAADSTGAAGAATPPTRPLPGVAAPQVPPPGSPTWRDPAAPDDRSRRLFIAGGVGAAVVVVIALLVGSLGHGHSPAPARATTPSSAAPASASLPPSLSSALQRLQQAVQP